MIEQGSAEFPRYLNAFFLAVVSGVLFMLVQIARRVGPRAPAILLGPLLAWLTFLSVLATLGFFEDFMSMPPRFIVAAGPPLVLLVVAAVHPATGALVQAVPPAWLVGFQTFRVFVEIAFWLLWREGRLATLMTFHGRNIDILVGLTAPLVVWLCFQARKVGPRFALRWNLFGIVVLLHTFASGVLGAPTPFRVFHVDPPNTFIASFPYILLPGFLVPAALIVHVLSIRQLLRAER